MGDAKKNSEKLGGKGDGGRTVSRLSQESFVQQWSIYMQRWGTVEVHGSDDALQRELQIVVVRGDSSWVLARLPTANYFAVIYQKISTAYRKRSCIFNKCRRPSTAGVSCDGFLKRHLFYVVCVRFARIRQKTRAEICIRRNMLNKAKQSKRKTNTDKRTNKQQQSQWRWWLLWING